MGRKRRRPKRRAPKIALPSPVRCLQVAVGLLLFCISVFIFKQSLLQQAAFSGSGGRMYEDIQSDPDTLVRWAKEELVKGNSSRAKEFYARALKSNSLSIPAWLGLCELAVESGEFDRAGKILEYIYSRTGGAEGYRWEVAMLAFQLENEELLAQTLKILITEERKYREQALYMADSIWSSSQSVLKRIGPENSLFLLQYYQKKKEAEKALAVWPSVENSIENLPKISLSFVNFLIQQGQIPAAAQIWRKYYPNEELLYNGSFTSEPLQRGFDWRIRKAEGMQWQLVDKDARKNLQIDFDGTQNLLFQMYQIVPLVPGTNYLLQGMMRSHELTTDQRPFWLINGFRCEGLSAKSNMVATNEPNHIVKLEFEVPEDCDAVTVQLRRNVSREFDNKIKGHLTLYDFSLTRMKESAGTWQ